MSKRLLMIIRGRGYIADDYGNQKNWVSDAVTVVAANRGAPSIKKNNQWQIRSSTSALYWRTTGTNAGSAKLTGRSFPPPPSSTDETASCWLGPNATAIFYSSVWLLLPIRKQKLKAGKMYCKKCEIYFATQVAKRSHLSEERGYRGHSCRVGFIHC